MKHELGSCGCDAWVWAFEHGCGTTVKDNANEKDKRKCYVKMCAQLNTDTTRAHKSIWHAFGVHKHEPNRHTWDGWEGEQMKTIWIEITLQHLIEWHWILYWAKISPNGGPFIKRARDSFWQISIAYSLTLIHSRFRLFSHSLAFFFMRSFILLPTLMKDFCNR